MRQGETRRHHGEIALVTGGNKGIGREIVRRLAAEGMTVYLGARDGGRGRKTARELAADGADVRFVLLDVTDPAQIDAAVARIDRDCGKLDALVNNAGIVSEWGAAVDDIGVDRVRQAFEVNVLGPVAVTRAFLPLLHRAPVGRVVNLSSPLGSLALLSDPGNPISTRGLLAYSSSKAALNAVTVLYANALRGTGIVVNAANPGLVASDLNVDSPFHRGTRTPEQGAEVPVRLALLDSDGPTGQFLGDGDSVSPVVPW